MKLKVCGMREITNILEVEKLLPDYLGFIFYPQSPRFVGEDFQMPTLATSIKKIGVFVNETTEEILAKVKVHALNGVQLHGQESVEQCAELRTHNLLIIKVFSVDDEFDFSLTKRYAPAVDFFLFDTKGKYYGGNAKRFNWSVLWKYDQDVPYFLSGGLSPENINEVNTLNDKYIHALDINSGVEIAPGIKDPVKVKLVREVMKSNHS
jgi:phosphoribosylanthranilate isomerase